MNSNKILIVVDMQNDFIDGTLGTEAAVKIVPKVKEKIEYYRNHNYIILFTKDTHDNNYMQTQEGKNLPISHCIVGTTGWEICDALKQFVDGADTYEKSTFGSVALAEDLRNIEGIEEIELVGLCTDICIISNAFLIKAFLPEVTVSIDSQCCAGVTQKSHENALEAMKQCQIKVY